MNNYHFDERTLFRMKLLSIDIDIGWFSDWPRSEQTTFTSHAEMQISPAWTLAPTGPMGTYVWLAEVVSLVAGLGVRYYD